MISSNLWSRKLPDYRVAGLYLGGQRMGIGSIKRGEEF